MKKNPRFFCDNCGIEVDRNTKACPRCGRFFASIRCPSCGFTGDESAFSGGCLSCGYSTPPGSINFTAPAKPMVSTGKLPLWVYVLSICAFIGVIALLICRLSS